MISVVRILMLAVGAAAVNIGLKGAASEPGVGAVGVGGLGRAG